MKHIQNSDFMAKLMLTSPILLVREVKCSGAGISQEAICSLPVHISDHSDKGLPELQEPEFSDLLQELSPPPLTDTRKGSVESYSKPGTQTQMPTGAEYHYQLYVTQIVSAGRR